MTAIPVFPDVYINGNHPMKKRRNDPMKKMISLALAVLMLLSVSIAFAKTVTPDDEYKGLAEDLHGDPV